MQVYDEVLVPRLFTPWARLLLEGLALEPGETVLDVACGPGSVTRLAAADVGAEGRVTGVDLSPAMLSIAMSKPAVPGAASIDYREAPADALPVADAEFDVALIQQGLQFFPDRIGALRELHRAVRPGGRVGIAVWGAIDEMPYFAALEGAVREVAGDELAGRYRGGPWGMPEAEQLRRALEDGGFDDVRVTRETLPLSFDDADQLITTLTASAIAADLDALSAEQREALGDAIKRNVAAVGSESVAVSNVGYARRS
ncbi:MAG: class I SAM-dependent methyltransferase [Gaiellaceae bacterium]